MAKEKQVIVEDEIPLEGLILQCKHDKYKLAYSAIRWAKEMKTKENLPDAIPTLVPRAIREILSGKVTYKEIEKLPMSIRVSTSAPAVAPSQPTLTLNVTPDDEA